MYQNQVNSLTQEITTLLHTSARSYYELGINHFHDVRFKQWIDFQPAIGNLAISVELLLKSIVAARAIRHLYTNLPEEAQLLLTYPESLTDDHRPHVYIRDMKAFVYKTIEIDKAVYFFNLFFPKQRQEFKQYFQTLSAVRNVSVHGSIPEFRRYELERIAYFSTKLFHFFRDSKLHKYFRININQKTDAFVTSYVEEEIKRVQEKIKSAETAAKDRDFTSDYSWPSGWEEMSTDCLICEEVGIAYGETVEEFDQDGLRLTFECSAFRCPSCGLELDSVEEMELASMETILDRSDDNDDWLIEFHGDERYY